MALSKSQRSLRAWTRQKWRTKSGKPSTEDQKLLANVIYLRKQLRLFLPVNMPPLRLKSERQLEEVNRYLNSQKRLQEKRKNTEATRRLQNELSTHIKD